MTVDIELEGQLEKITFCNEENHYTIARVKVKGYGSPVTVVGNLVRTSPGEVLRLRGFWETHPKYGEQFRIISYESVVPATAKGIERYLGSGLIRGIGPVMARRLVDKFGEGTLDVIENHAERLQEVEGIGSKRIEMIRTAWEEQKEVREVMLFLQGHEVSSSYAARIYRQYGKDSIRVVRENPYRLAEDIFGIGFLTADRISVKLGIPKDSMVRAEAGISHVLHRLADEGHVYFPYGPFVEECRQILDIETDIIVRAVEKIRGEKKIVVEDAGEEQNVYLAIFHLAEVEIAGALRTIASGEGRRKVFDREGALEWVGNTLGISFAGKQLQAIRDAMEQKVMVVTGGPGTGKTTIINAILALYRKAGLEVLLAAPTGRAAKRMSEATGFAAKTIHRLLEFSPSTRGFKRNEENLLEADLIVIDEVSMVDTLLMHSLLKAVPGHATLILVGDVDQIPSVGAGNVLKDIIGSGCIPTVRLDEIFRQSGESLIIVNAHRINSGQMPVTESRRDVPQDFYFVQMDDPEEAAKIVLDMCRRRVPEKFGYDPISDIQVLAPMHRGIAGVSNLNAELQKCLNPSAAELHRGGRTLRHGDKVMQIRNNYEKDVYNGDIGRIVSINAEDQEVIVNFDGKNVRYDFAELDELVLAYAVSVHKSQGSEYPVVVMPLLTQHYMMLQRNLLYTAITRGRKLVILIGTKKALAIAIKNNKPQLRYTRLKERLISGFRN